MLLRSVKDIPGTLAQVTLIYQVIGTRKGWPLSSLTELCPTSTEKDKSQSAFQRTQDYQNLQECSTENRNGKQRIQSQQTMVSYKIIDQNQKRSIAHTTYDNVNTKNFDSQGHKPYQKDILKNNVFPQCNPNSMQFPQATQTKMLTNANRDEIQENRPVYQNVTDFKSTLQKHDKNDKKLQVQLISFPQTTYKCQYRQNKRANSVSVISQLTNKNNTFAGASQITTQKRMEEAIRQRTNIIGEAYSRACEAKDNTSVRKTWLPVTDKSLKYADLGHMINQNRNTQTGWRPKDTYQTYKVNISQQLPHDIMTSTNMQKGLQTLHPFEKVAFRRVRQDVTMIANKPWSKK